MRADVVRLLCVLDVLGRAAPGDELVAIMQIPPRRVRAALVAAEAANAVAVTDAGNRRPRYRALAAPHDGDRKHAARLIAAWCERNGGSHAETGAWWAIADDAERARGFFEAAAVDAELHGAERDVLAHLSRAAQLETDRGKRAALARRAARTESRAGRYAAAEQRLRAALDDAGDEPDAAARVAIDLARVRLAQADARGAESALARGLRTARDTAVAGELIALRTLLRVVRGERIARPAAASDAPRGARALLDAALLRANGAPAAAAALLTATLAGPLAPEHVPALRLALSRALGWSGPLHAARAFTEESSAWATGVGERAAAAPFAYEAAWYATLAGELDRARAYLAAVVPGAGAPADEAARIAAALALALACGDRDQLGALLDARAFARILADGVVADVDRLGAAFARATAALGDAVGARRVLDVAAARIPRTAAAPFLLVEAAALRADVGARFAAALERAAERGANALLAAFAAVAAAHDPARPLDERERLGDAAATGFERCGWYGQAARVRALVLPATALSPRRAEVASLAADGYSNAQIAQRLGISPHTVQHHMSAVLRDLGLRSRWQLPRSARLAER